MDWRVDGKDEVGKQGHTKRRKEKDRDIAERSLESKEVSFYFFQVDRNLRILLGWNHKLKDKFSFISSTDLSIVQV